MKRSTVRTQPELQRQMVRIMTAVDQLLIMLGLQEPFTCRDLVAAVASLKGVPIEVYPHAALVYPYTGMALVSPTKYIILYPADDVQDQAELTIAHELIHVIMDHQGETIELAADTAARFNTVDLQQAWRCCGRTSYANRDELVAEVGGTYLVTKFAPPTGPLNSVILI